MSSVRQKAGVGVLDSCSLAGIAFQRLWRSTRIPFCLVFWDIEKGLVGFSSGTDLYTNF